ncbi:hypothetical protein [Pseudomonas sp. G166]|uniref:hypothetical protein n=1 Tax=Pseudomonas sp. G166 TaxID=3094846 RepID=UPI00300A62BA
MRSFSKRSSTRLATAALLLGSLTLAGAAQAAVEVSSATPSYDDAIPALHHDQFDKYKLVKTNVSASALESLPKTVKNNTDELENQKRVLGEQARQIEELKRNSGSSSNSSSKEIDELKRTIKEQEDDLKDLGKQVEELKRNSGSSSSSSNSEISSLKRELSDQDSQMDQLKRTVEELSRKVK